MRQVVLDTETTGLSYKDGHRVIEIGCIEMIDRQLTGEHFHVYLDPERRVDEGAFKVHGLSDDFLKDKPLFKIVAEEFMAFVDGAQLIIHNAPFDIGFLDMELNRYQKKYGSLTTRCTIVDTLVMAKEKHPGQKNNLDALCRRYDVDNTSRELHGALLDAEILALVYLEMTGGQSSLFDASANSSKTSGATILEAPALKREGPINVIKANNKELEEHHSYLKRIVKESGQCIWQNEKETVH